MKNLANYIRKTAMFGLMAVSLAACNDDDPAFVGGGTGTGNDTGIPGLSEDMLGLFAYNGSTDVESNVWDEYMSMGLFLTKDSIGNPYENDRSTYSNIRCEYTKEGWTTDPREIKLSDRPAVIYAYAPYLKDTDPFNVPVECASGNYYMYGTHLEPQTSVRKGDNIAKIHMKHALALVDFRIKKLDWDGELVLQKLVIRRKGWPKNDSIAQTIVPDSMNALPIGGLLNIQSGELTRTVFGQYVSKTVSAVVTEDFNTSARIIQTVMPMDIEPDMVELAFTLNGFEKSITLKSDKDWVAGCRSIINLTFTGEGVEFDVAIKPWEDVEQDITVNT